MLFKPIFRRVFDIEKEFPKDTIPKTQLDSTGSIEGIVLEAIKVIYH